MIVCSSSQPRRSDSALLARDDSRPSGTDEQELEPLDRPLRGDDELQLELVLLERASAARA